MANVHTNVQYHTSELCRAQREISTVLIIGTHYYRFDRIVLFRVWRSHRGARSLLFNPFTSATLISQSLPNRPRSTYVAYGCIRNSFIRFRIGIGTVFCAKFGTPYRVSFASLKWVCVLHRQGVNEGHDRRNPPTINPDPQHFVFNFSWDVRKLYFNIFCLTVWFKSVLIALFKKYWNEFEQRA